MLLFLDSFRAMIAGSSHWLALAILAAMALTFFVYRRTNPVVAAPVRYALTTLRSAALLLLILALYELTLQFRQKQTTPPLLAIAIDQSASMQQKDGGSSRAEAMQLLIRTGIAKELDQELAIKYYGFDAHVAELGRANEDSLSFAGDATDITSALEAIKSRLLEQNLAAILLLSDGNYTQGGDPGRYAAEIGVPVYTIGFGSVQSQADIGITTVEANPFAFIGEATPIRVTLRSSGQERENVRLSLQDATGEAAASALQLQRGPVDSAVVLMYTPERAGRQKLGVTVAASSGDANHANNRYTLYLDVLKSRTMIYIIAGSVSPDLNFLRSHLRTNDRFDLRLLAELGGDSNQLLDRGRALQDSIDQGDLFVIYNFPGRRSSPQTLALLLAALEKRPRPVLFISGRDTDWSRLKPLEPFLPIRAEVLSSGEIEATPVLTPAGQQHPVMQIPGSGSAAWSLLPPVYTSHRLRAWWPDTEILAHARPTGSMAPAGAKGDNWPFILVRSAGAKSAAIMGYDLWRWHLMMAGIGNEEQAYHHFFQNLVRWLQIEQNSDLVRVRSDQSTYHFGDEVHLTTQIVDAQFQPVDDAEVRLIISKGEPGKNLVTAPADNAAPGREIAASRGTELYLTPGGKGSYSGAFRPEAAGDYQVTAEVLRSGKKAGEASHLFSVGSYNQELSDVALKENILRRLAAQSGGGYAGADSATALIRSIHGTSLHRTLSREVELWHRSALLIAILLLLSLEWYLRRSKGML